MLSLSIREKPRSKNRATSFFPVPRFTPSLVKRLPVKFHPAQTKPPSLNLSAWRWKISPPHCWFIEQRQQLNTDIDNLVGEVLANSSSLSLGSGIKHVAMMART